MKTIFAILLMCFTGFAFADGHLEGEESQHAETEADSESPSDGGAGGGMPGGMPDMSGVGGEGAPEPSESTETLTETLDVTP